MTQKRNTTYRYVAESLKHHVWIKSDNNDISAIWYAVRKSKYLDYMGGTDMKLYWRQNYSKFKTLCSLFGTRRPVKVKHDTGIL